MTFFDRLNSKAASFGFTALELSMVTVESDSLRAVSGEVAEGEVSLLTGTTLVGVLKEKDGIHLGRITFDGSDGDVDELLSLLKENASLFPAGTVTDLVAPGECYAPTIAPEKEQASASQKRALLESLLSALKAEKGITGIPAAGYESNRTTKVLMNSRGLMLSDTYASTSLYAEAIAQGKDDLKVGVDYAMASAMKEFDPIALSKKVASRAREMLGATQIASGTYPVVLSREASSALLSTFASCFSGENAIRALTPFIGKEGEMIASPLVTLYNNILEARYGRRTFDDEGMPTQKTVLIEKGVFKRFFDSRKTASERKTTSTGNGFGGQCLPGFFRMANGTTSVEELYASAEGGVLVTELEGLHAGANALTGDYNCQASGFRIRNGMKAEPLNLMVLSGNFATLLREIRLVGDDRDDARDGAAPSLLLPRATISGK